MENEDLPPPRPPGQIDLVRLCRELNELDRQFLQQILREQADGGAG